MEKKVRIPLILTAFLLLINMSCSLFERGLPGEVKEYLESRGEALSVDYDQVERPVNSLASYLNDARLYLLGEAHGSAFNYQVFFSILKALKTSRGNVRVISESGYANTMAINQYLQTGDEVYLTFLLNALYGSVSSNDQYFCLFQHVYEYNQNIPDSERISFLGIDLDHQLDTALYAVHLLMPKNSMHEKPQGLLQLEELLNPILAARFRRSAYPSGHYDRIEEFFQTLAKELAEIEEGYHDFLGEGFREFQMIVESAVASMEWYAGGIKDVAFREEFMYKQFLRAAATISENTTMLGLFGMSHVYKRSAERTTIAEMLHTREDSPVRGKVASVHLFYLDSFRMSRDTGTSEEIRTDFQDDLEPFALGKAGIFSLDEEGSPFRDGCYLVFDEFKMGSRPTSDYFNLMILIQNSPACSRWKIR